MTSSSTPAPTGYDAAYDQAVRFNRSGRTRLLVSGRAPGQMLGGVLTGHIPGEPGKRHYSTVLTPKGRMISDLFVVRLPGEEEQFFLDVPDAGREGLLAYFKRVLPPRFAKVTNVTADWEHTAVVGPAAAHVLARAGDAAGFARINKADLEALSADEVLFAEEASGSTWIVRSPDTVPPRYDVFCPKSQGEGEHFSQALAEAVPVEGSDEAWEVLRIEAGFPEFGRDMTEKTIPIEAGIEGRAIDHSKGCYTGQEVIVRILHRGHVNRHLRTLRVDAGGASPSRDDELFVADSDKAVGLVTSVANLPREGGSIALAYVRREVEVGQTLDVGSSRSVHATVLERGPLR